MAVLRDGDVLRNPGLDGQAPESKAVATRWRRVLVWFLRLLSLVWIAKGLTQWGVILGLGPEAGPPFEARPLTFQAIIVYFAVFDLVAAVGLWLTATWGGVLWLLAAMSHLLLGFFFPRWLPLSPALVAGYVGLMMAYFLATWAAENRDG
jgi:fatty acid desaturase